MRFRPRLSLPAWRSRLLAWLLRFRAALPPLLPRAHRSRTAASSPAPRPAAPGAARVVGRDYRPGDIGNYALRQQQPVDVVCGGAVGLPEDLGMRKKRS